MWEYLEYLEYVPPVLFGLAIAVLVAGVVQHLKNPPVGEVTPWPVRVAQLLVCACAAAGLGLGLMLNVEHQLEIWTWISFVLVLVLLRFDQRFWVGLLVLWTLYLAVGVVSVRALQRAYLHEAGDWFGVRLLVAWAGPEAVPAAPDSTLVMWFLAITRFALPLAMTVAIAWILAQHRRTTRLQRLGLVLSAGAFLSELLVGALVSTITMVVGSMRGLPASLAIPAVIGAVIVLFTVGPGAILGLFSGVSDLLRKKALVDAAGSLVSSVREAREVLHTPERTVESAEPTLSSLGRFLRGKAGFVRKLNVFLIVAALGVLWMLKLAAPPRTDNGEISYQYVDAEIRLSERPIRVVGQVDDTLWVLTQDHVLQGFETVSRQWTRSTVGIADAALAQGRLFAVTSAEAVQFGEVAADGQFSALTDLGPGGLARMETVGEGFVVSRADGDVHHLAADGSITSSWTSFPVEGMVPDDDGSVWLLYRPLGAPENSLHADRHDPATGDLLTTGEVGDNQIVYLWSQQAYFHQLVRRWGTVQESLTDTTDSGWRFGDFGRVVRSTGDEPGRSTERWFSYDQVIDVFETSDGTWLVVDDFRGLGLSPRSEPAAYLVRWAHPS